MRAHFGLPSVEAEDKEGKPPISVKFEIPYFTTSGIQVRARAAGRRAAMDRPHEPHRDPESVQAQRVVGDTQQCSQLRKGFSSACRRRRGAAPALPLPMSSLRSNRKRPTLVCSDPTLCFSSEPRDIFSPQNLEFEPLVFTRLSHWGLSSWALP